MALMLSTAARLKPEIRLAEVVSQFEAALSNDQKTKFRTYKSQTIAVPPDTKSVMQLTGEIDRSQRHGSRCYGPRFTSFLHGVQQYVALGDVVVGGSQNIIACGVWSLVRMSLLAIVNHGSYRESLSRVFMEIGRTIPRYQAMALLYPRSKTLQAQIHEYFIVVVNLCRQIVVLTQQSLLKKLTATLSDLDVKSIQADLAMWATSIKDEAYLRMAERIEEEAQENSQSRTLALKFSKSAKHERNISARLRFLDMCSTYDYETSWRQIRKKGSTTQFSKTMEYMSWKGAKHSQTLVYTGQLGSGKSVMLSNIIDDLNLHMHGPPSPVAYFFCDHDIPQSIVARTIFGAIVRQIIQSSASQILLPDLKLSTLSCEEMSRHLERILPKREEIFIILDGLDLCDLSEFKELIKLVRTVQEAYCIHLCISLRTGLRDAPYLISKALKEVKVIAQPENSADIEAFIDTELERCLENQALVVGDASLILEVRGALTKGSQGMFLWAALQIHSLCDMQTDQEIRSALDDLPRDLPEIYRRILSNSTRARTSYQRKVLAFLVTAKRPFTRSELQEALSVVPFNTKWSSEQAINDLHSVLSCCGCLVNIDEEELTVRLVHPSVGQFILTGYKDTDNRALGRDAAETLVANTILTYVNYDVFETALTRAPHTCRDTKVDAASTISKIGQLTTGSRYAVRLLKTQRTSDVDISKVLKEAAGLRQQSRNEQESYKFPFRTYALSLGPCHVLLAKSLKIEAFKYLPMILKQDLSATMDALHPLMQPDPIKYEKAANPNFKDYSFFHLTVICDNIALFHHLLPITNMSDLAHESFVGFTPLDLAIFTNRPEMVRVLVQRLMLKGHFAINSIFHAVNTAILLEYRHIEKIIAEEALDTLIRNHDNETMKCFLFDSGPTQKDKLVSWYRKFCADAKGENLRQFLTAVESENSQALEMLFGAGVEVHRPEARDSILERARRLGSPEVLHTLQKAWSIEEG